MLIKATEMVGRKLFIPHAGLWSRFFCRGVGVKSFVLPDFCRGQMSTEPGSRWEETDQLGFSVPSLHSKDLVLSSEYQI